MASIKRLLLILLYTSIILAATVNAQEESHEQPSLQLSEPLMELLRAEMQAILAAIKLLPAGIATADWQSVATTSEQIRNSYLLQQKLSPEQRSELASKLPDYFKRLDAGFHLEANKLEMAARQHDPQLAAFHYYRMLESCTACHTTYASTRFPNFSHQEVSHHH